MISRRNLFKFGAALAAAPLAARLPETGAAQPKLLAAGDWAYVGEATSPELSFLPAEPVMRPGTFASFPSYDWTILSHTEFGPDQKVMAAPWLGDERARLVATIKAQVARLNALGVQHGDVVILLD